MKKPVLVVGAGFSGSVIARILAEDGWQIIIKEKRDHIGGNAYDFVNKHGIRVHKYGPHIFHTNNKKIVDWLSQFTDWEIYQHKVKAQLTSGEYVTLPPNIDTAERVGKENIVDIFFDRIQKKCGVLRSKILIRQFSNECLLDQTIMSYISPTININ